MTVFVFDSIAIESIEILIFGFVIEILRIYHM